MDMAQKVSQYVTVQSIVDEDQNEQALLTNSSTMFPVNKKGGLIPSIKKVVNRRQEPMDQLSLYKTIQERKKSDIKKR